MKFNTSKWAELVIEKNVDIPKAANKKRGEFYNFLETLEIGDSFVIDAKNTTYSGVSPIIATAKKIGMRLVSRKIYSEDNPKDYHYRIWYTEKIDPHTTKKPANQRKKYKVVHQEDPSAGNYDAETGRLPNDILFLAEQNEENREIVEDIRRLNRILIEELGKQNLLTKKGK